jgi:hypothetical protein
MITYHENHKYRLSRHVFLLSQLTMVPVYLTVLFVSWLITLVSAPDFHFFASFFTSLAAVTLTLLIPLFLCGWLFFRDGLLSLFIIGEYSINSACCIKLPVIPLHKLFAYLTISIKNPYEYTLSELESINIALKDKDGKAYSPEEFTVTLERDHKSGGHLHIRARNLIQMYDVCSLEIYSPRKIQATLLLEYE